MAEVVVRSVPGAAFRHEVLDGRHALTADEPREAGGDDAGPNPYELLLGALGTCTSMTILMYARRKGWPVERVVVKLRHSQIHAKDCGECDTRDGHVDQIEREVHLEGALDAEQRRRLLEIAGKCPVHRTLTSEIRIVTRES